MTDLIQDLFGTSSVVCAVDGPTVHGDRDAVDLIGHAMQEGAGLVVVPVARLDPRFFELRTGVAGDVVGKFASYRIRLAIVGDIQQHVRRSAALQALVRESNRGDQLWFVEDLADLRPHLDRPPNPALR